MTSSEMVLHDEIDFSHAKIQHLKERIKELETQNAIYHDLKDVSLTKDLERIAELEAKLKKELEQDYCSQCGVDIDKAVDHG